MDSSFRRLTTLCSLVRRLSIDMSDALKMTGREEGPGLRVSPSPTRPDTTRTGGAIDDRWDPSTIEGSWVLYRATNSPLYKRCVYEL